MSLDFAKYPKKLAGVEDPTKDENKLHFEILTPELNHAKRGGTEKKSGKRLSKRDGRRENIRKKAVRLKS